MDETGAAKHVETVKISDKLLEIKNKIKQAKQDLYDLSQQKAFEKRSQTLKLIDSLEQEYELEDKLWHKNMLENPVEITEEDIARTISLISGVSVEKVNKNETEKLLMMESKLKSIVIGQEKAVEKVSKAIKLRNKMHIISYLLQNE